MSQSVEALLLEIYHSRGRLDPKDVVDEARSPRSPLHEKFEWDNDEAAEQWRLQQARALIRSVKIERVVHPDEPARMVRFYVHDPEADGYLATEDVAKMPSVRDRVLDEMRRDLTRLQSKWDLYRETFEQIAADVLFATVAEEEAQEPATQGS